MYFSEFILDSLIPTCEPNIPTIVKAITAIIIFIITPADRIAILCQGFLEAKDLGLSLLSPSSPNNLT